MTFASSARLLIVLRGGGDLASGVAYRLRRAGLRLLITELPQPLVVRRKASFAEAAFCGETRLEGMLARRCTDPSEALALLDQEILPVLIDPQAKCLEQLAAPLALVDGRMTKRPPEALPVQPALVIGLGPGFAAGENCHAVIETNRGHHLGRVLWQGAAQSDTGIPDSVLDRRQERVLRAPADGALEAYAEIGDLLQSGQIIARVAGLPITAPFDGALRGLIYPGLLVRQGMKVGDLDPRGDPRYCTQISDKALSIGGGVLEAILTRPELRPRLWND